MKNRITLLVLLIYSMLVCAGCAIKMNSSHMLFRIDDIYYQTWITNEDIRGTDIVITISDVNPEVEFQSVAFRGFEVPVSITRKGKNLMLKGIINRGLPVIEDKGNEFTNTPDRIIYTFNGKEYNYPLTDIRREEMRYDSR